MVLGRLAGVFRLLRREIRARGFTFTTNRPSSAKLPVRWSLSPGNATCAMTFAVSAPVVGSTETASPPA